MLVDFAVTNFRSFRETQTLSLMSDATTKDFSENIHLKHSLLKSAFIYGPNASGKSTLIEALRLMRSFIIESARTQRGDEISWATPFKLNTKMLTQPIVFEITFILPYNNIKYEYGFAVTKTSVVEEWLIEYRSSRPSQIFKRCTHNKKKQTKWNFKRGFKQSDIPQRTLENTLFLSKAAQENHEYLAPIFDWFRQHLIVQSSQRDYNSIIRRCIEDDFIEKKKKILLFLQDADVGIADLQIQRIHNEQLLQSVHIMNDSKRKVAFDFLSDESDGTISMLALATYLIDASAHNRVIVIDELDKSLHPLLIRELLVAFHKFAKNSQLIFTTHNIQLMDEELFRKDQIWLMEKNRPSESSSLFRLSDLKGIRKEHAFDRRYLLGAYGALPILGEFDLGSHE